MKTTLLIILLFCLSGENIVHSSNLASEQPDIVSVKGNDVFQQTHQAVAALGGMEKFVKHGQTVGILVNSGFREKGAYVDPDVVIATIKMAYEAGAADIVFLQNIVPEYWERSHLEPEYRQMINCTRTIEANHFPSKFSEEYFIKINDVEGATHLAELEVVKEFFEVDVFINIPVAKNHTLTGITNSMKNMMGINTRESNVTFHLNGPSRNDPHFLASCIAELCLLRQADLIISDVSYVLVTNGPGGPGEIMEPQRIVAGVDPVAVDAYCAALIGFCSEDVLTLQKGYDMGLGQMDLEYVNILEIDMEL